MDLKVNCDIMQCMLGDQCETTITH